VTRKSEDPPIVLGTDTYVLRLYIAGSTPKSQRAVENIKKICEEYLRGRYELEIIDIYQTKTLGIDDQIIAAPTFIKVLPPPLRTIMGDMSDKERVLSALGLREKK
jgi:circadian clock protein KaiB